MSDKANDNAIRWCVTILGISSYSYVKQTLEMVIYAKKNNKEYETGMRINGTDCEGHLAGKDIIKASTELLDKLLEIFSKYSI